MKKLWLLSLLCVDGLKASEDISPEITPVDTTAVALASSSGGAKEEGFSIQRCNKRDVQGNARSTSSLVRSTETRYAEQICAAAGTPPAKRIGREAPKNTPGEIHKDQSPASAVAQAKELASIVAGSKELPGVSGENQERIRRALLHSHPKDPQAVIGRAIVDALPTQKGDVTRTDIEKALLQVKDSYSFQQALSQVSPHVRSGFTPFDQKAINKVNSQTRAPKNLLYAAVDMFDFVRIALVGGEGAEDGDSGESCFFLSEVKRLNINKAVVSVNAPTLFASFFINQECKVSKVVWCEGVDLDFMKKLRSHSEIIGRMSGIEVKMGQNGHLFIIETSNGSTVDMYPIEILFINQSGSSTMIAHEIKRMPGSTKWSDGRTFFIPNQELLQMINQLEDKEKGLSKPEQFKEKHIYTNDGKENIVAFDITYELQKWMQKKAKENPGISQLEINRKYYVKNPESSFSLPVVVDAKSPEAKPSARINTLHNVRVVTVGGGGSGGGGGGSGSSGSSGE
jgi:hypothetical protein